MVTLYPLTLLLQRLLKMICRLTLWLVVLFGLTTSSGVKVSDAALLVLPHGVQQRLLWERALIVYDRLSRQQTVIAEVAVSGSPRHFAILVCTPPSATIDYTTTRIWRYLRRHLKRRVITKSKLSLEPYSLLLNSWRREEERSKAHHLDYDVFKSTDTQVHAQERALHEWIIQKGLTLTPAQALSIKRVYQSGEWITALWVKPRLRDRSGQSQSLKQTWTSTWIFTHEVDYPQYVSLFPPAISDVYGGAHEARTQSASADLKLSLIAESPFSITLQDPLRAERFKLPTPHHPTQSKALERLEVNELSGALITSPWSYKRGGVLSHFALKAPQGLKKIKGASDDNGRLITPPAEYKERLHVLSIPIELVLIALAIIGRMFIRSRRKVLH